MTVKRNHFILFLFLSFFTLLTTNLKAQSQNQNQNENQETTTNKDVEEEKEDNRRWRDTPTRYHKWTIHFGDDLDDNGIRWNSLRVGLMDIGFSTYFFENSLNLPAELDDFDQDYGGSLNFNLHAIRHRLPIVKDKIGLEYGLSFSWKQYKFSNDFQIAEDTIPFTIVDDGTKYKKNKLKTTFLEIPVMLTITGKKNFYISGGMYGGVLLGAKQKLKDDDGNKLKIKDDFNLNKFRYGVVGRIGFGPFAVYAQLSMNDLFKKGQGPELTPFNVGISILDF